MDGRKDHDGMSTAYQNLTPAQLREEYAAVKAQFDALKAKELKLNMARGKPGREQLDLVSGILSIRRTASPAASTPATTASFPASKKRRNTGRTYSAANRRSASSAATRR